MPHRIRVLKPAQGIFAFYDGRIEGYRYSADENWVDDGALSLGIASYAIVDGDAAVIYDTHVSIEHARFIRTFLEARGVSKFQVVLSHWHLDHIAGTDAFAGCRILANERTAALLTTFQAAIEAGTHHGPPVIRPLVMPTETFRNSTTLELGSQVLELIHVDIHSDDGTVIWLPERRLLLAGDTVEDSVTYVAEPDRLSRHIEDLDRLWSLGAARILPNHGDPEVIAAGGYDPRIIRATQSYVRLLQQCAGNTRLRESSLREMMSRIEAAETLKYYPPYEQVHRRNVASVVELAPV